LSKRSNIQLAFFGDDLTGSTDALQFLTEAGMKTVLFMDTPTEAMIAQHGGLQAFGIAGHTRALNTSEMGAELLPAFTAMKASGAPHVHYKVCSTFDSSPSTGSIGAAIDCAASLFSSSPIPVIGGMPALGRYCVFGNLFARMGIGSGGEIYRLDRHPSMSRHPVTPADESDLRLHIGKQTKKSIALLNYLDQQAAVEEWLEKITSDAEVLLLDAVDDEALLKIGEWLNVQAVKQTLFSVGPSSVEAALGRYWQKQGMIAPRKNWQTTGKAQPLLVISGSCSPVTAAQIEHAKAAGFETLELDATDATGSIPGLVKEGAEILRQNKDLIIHSGTKTAALIPSEVLGKALGTIAATLVESCSLRRVGIAGGDTSSYAARAMDVEALEMIAPLVAGAPLCSVHSSRNEMHGLEINLKGGQVGAPDFFIRLRNGK